MEDLIIKPDESIILLPGEMLKPGEQPLRIRFGTVDFDVSEGSVQQQILSNIAQYLQHAAPIHWRIVTVKHFRQLAEWLGEPLVALIPQAISWKRTAKGKQYAVHDVDVLVLGQLDVNETVGLIDQWADLFLDGGGSLDCAACMNAVPLDGAEAGYDVDELTKTPSTFLGGLRLTFWE